MQNALFLNLIKDMRFDYVTVLSDGYSFSYRVTDNGYWIPFSSRWNG